jgi:hypothetical protein
MTEAFRPPDNRPSPITARDAAPTPAGDFPSPLCRLSQAKRPASNNTQHTGRHAGDTCIPISRPGPAESRLVMGSWEHCRLARGFCVGLASICH